MTTAWLTELMSNPDVKIVLLVAAGVFLGNRASDVYFLLLSPFYRRSHSHQPIKSSGGEKSPSDSDTKGSKE